ncbi:MAG: hypothetical protein CMG55_02740 [Candidatus Marinimicrobia bacterium]|nr:hypothetical protein [Candidatus Neomarinimicrobiota bacterium]|tara:strand:+ start:443 stop:1645 length:1203 start_codon:yes stop_codon:yes gene_type:complete
MSFNFNQNILRVIPLIFFIVFSIQPLKACKLWSVCTKSTYTFSNLSIDESLKIENQLTTFFYQSETLLDGWSLLGYGDSDSDSLKPIYRSNRPATQDSALYWSAVETLLNDSPNRIGIGHLRIASSGANAIANPHPWMFYDSGRSFSLVHNGTVNKDLLYNLITNYQTDLSWIESHPPQTFDGGDWRNIGWANVVDSELILLFLMQNIATENNIILGLQMALGRLVDVGIPASQLNLIFSDGETLFVFGGNGGLYFAESSEFFSVMTYPDYTGGLNWTTINDRELLMFSHFGFERYPNFVSSASDEDVIISPNYFTMGNAYPNPFNGSISFPIDGVTSGPVQISIFSVNGKMVQQYNIPGLDNESRIVQWQPTRDIATGTYIIHTRSNQIVNSKKILFIK